MPKPSVHNPREADVAANPEKYVATVFMGVGKFEKLDLPVTDVATAWALADAFAAGVTVGLRHGGDYHDGYARAPKEAMLYAVRGDRQALMVRGT